MKKTAPAKPESAPIAHFEKSLDELEGLVSNLEKGELSLDESLKSFERGIALFRQCQSALNSAEQQVNLLSNPADPESAVPFESDSN